MAMTPAFSAESSSLVTPFGPFVGVAFGDEPGVIPSPLRHGLPLVVNPLHVVAGFLESDRSRRDSGVSPWKAILFLSER